MPAEPALVTGARSWAADEQIVSALRAGDEHVFRDLYERQLPGDEARRPRLRRLGRRRGGDRPRDLDGDRSPGSADFEGRSALSTWIFSILINQAKSHNARERRALPFSSIASSGDEEPAVDADRFQKDDEAWPGHWATPPRPWQKPERRLLSLEARAQLKEALAQLP